MLTVGHFCFATIDRYWTETSVHFIRCLHKRGSFQADFVRQAVRLVVLFQQVLSVEDFHLVIVPVVIVLRLHDVDVVNLITGVCCGPSDT